MRTFWFNLCCKIDVDKYRLESNHRHEIKYQACIWLKYVDLTPVCNGKFVLNWYWWFEQNIFRTTKSLIAYVKTQKVTSYFQESSHTSCHHLRNVATNLKIITTHHCFAWNMHIFLYIYFIYIKTLFNHLFLSKIYNASRALLSVLTVFITFCYYPKLAKVYQLWNCYQY